VFSAVVGVRAAGKAALAITNNQQGQSKIITPTKCPTCCWCCLTTKPITQDTTTAGVMIFWKIIF